ncbi:hypothetical protein GOP47_0026465 [Adiantum capillus-veneris]|nr:hypothetical protein GOP47_0026465 [Adiantum capillus-veneris]
MEWSVPMGSVNVLQGEQEPSWPLSRPRDFNQGNKRRSLHSSGKAETDDEELLAGVEKKRRLTVEQVNYLESSFSMDLKLEPERKALLAKQLGIRPRQVAIWFQNRRARWKTQQLEQDYESLKTRYETVVKEKERLLKDHDSAKEANKRLQAEVARLTSSSQSFERSGMMEAREEQLSGGKSEVMSTSKSANDQSETQDSGQSYQTPPDAVLFATANPCMEQPSSVFVSDVPGVPCSFPSDYNHGGLPLLVQQLIAKGYFPENAYNVFYDCEKQFGGVAWCYQ